MKFNYTPLPKELTISKSNIQGLGLFCIKDLPPGMNLGRTHHSVDDMLIRTPLGGFINHSEQPNCYIDNNYKLHTIRKINRLEELTVYYRLTV